MPHAPLGPWPVYCRVDECQAQLITCPRCFAKGRFYLRCPVCPHGCDLPPPLYSSQHLVGRPPARSARQKALRARKVAAGLCYVCALKDNIPARRAGLCSTHYAQMALRRAAAELRRKPRRR